VWASRPALCCGALFNLSALRFPSRNQAGGNNAGEPERATSAKLKANSNLGKD
jgi:hypothetical protein